MTRSSTIIRLASQIIAQHEAFFSRPYVDIAGFPTRGYGELLERKVVPKKHWGGRAKYGVRYVKPSYCRERGWVNVSREEGQRFLENYVGRDLNYLNGDLNLSLLSDNKIIAILSLMYNIGQSKWRYSTVRKWIIRNPHDYEKITKGFAMWRLADGKISKGLVRRRREEAELYCGDGVVETKKEKPKRTRRRGGGR